MGELSDTSFGVPSVKTSALSYITALIFPVSSSVFALFMNTPYSADRPSPAAVHKGRDTNADAGIEAATSIHPRRMLITKLISLMSGTTAA